MDQDKYIGRLLDNRYEIQEVIGTGGMAVVYKARCHRLNRLVAIKILKDEYTEDEDFRRRFHSEGQAVAMLSHPNIVSVYDVSTSGDADYIVMELIDGITLKQYMEMKGVLNWKETLHFAMQIAKALEHAHSRGIVHRDIKPHNVMVLKNGSVKVTDFGIARVMSKSNTLTKEALGSVHYISPEQAKGGRVDNRSDLYSLGVVMYEMITGRPPYDGESPVAVAIQHINGGAAMPSTLNPNIPGGLEQIIMKAMAHQPGDRYPSATAMLYDLDEFRKEPTMLFDYHVPPTEDVTRLRGIQTGTTAPRNTAQRVAASRGEGTQPPRASQPQPQRRASGSGSATGRTNPPARRPREESRKQEENQAATIAIVSCASVAIVAIGIFLWLLFSGSMTPAQNTVVVPNLRDQVFANDLATRYPDFVIKFSDYQQSDVYEKDRIMDQTPKAGETVAKGSEIHVVVSLGKEQQTKVMDDLLDVDQDQAVKYLVGQGVEESRILIREESSEVYEAGRVTRTEPAAKEDLPESGPITLWVSTGPEVVKKNMPYVVGQTYDTAYKILNNAGFTNIRPEYVESQEDQNKVVEQSVERNALTDVTTEIVLKVSLGPAETTVETTAPPTTEAPTSAPTDPQPVKRTCTIYIVDAAGVPLTMEEDFTFQLFQDGELVFSKECAAGTTYVSVTLEGLGTVQYQVYVNDVFLRLEKVEFGG